VKKADSVADVLEIETKSTIADWLRRVDSEPDLLEIPLTNSERSFHLPEMFRDLVTRLRYPLPIGTRALTSDTAHDHGFCRRLQGYTPVMIVEESRMLEASIFQTLQLNQARLDPSVLLVDVMAIADEVDSQLAQAMTGYIREVDGTTVN
jgi:hypothetical protein